MDTKAVIVSSLDKVFSDMELTDFKPLKKLTALRGESSVSDCYKELPEPRER